MVDYALQVDKCPCYFYQVNGVHIVALHQLILGGLSGQHPHLQQEFGRTLATHSVGPSNPSVAQTVC